MNKNVLLGLVALLLVGCGGGSSSDGSSGTTTAGGGSTSAVSLAVSLPVISMGNTVTLTASGGSGNYTYWGGGNGIVTTSGVFTPTTAGTLTVTVTDSTTQKTATATVIVKATSSLFVAGYQTCGKLSTGDLECFGYDAKHSITSTSSNSGNSSPIKADSTTVTDSALTGMSGSNESGNENYCYIVSGGVLCSGYNADGQLGNGTTTAGTLVQATGLTTGVTQVSVSQFFACALKSDGSVWCWGNNAQGQVGNGSTVNQLTPTEVITTGATYIATADSNACAVVSSVLKCWGSNLAGQLNANTGVTCFNGDACSQSPISITGMTTNVSRVAISSDGVICGIQSGAAKCWGGIDGGTTYEAELGTNSAPSSTPSGVLLMTTGVSQLVSNKSSFCAVKSGNVYCWGSNTYGNIGDGTIADKYTATEVLTLSGNVTTLASGDYHVCALKTDGSISCWGNNLYGSLGSGGTSNESTPVVPGNWL